jgi:tetratricopeptide (TPR) repeat protein
MLRPRPGDIDWNVAIAALGTTSDTASLGHSAQVLSLSALYTPDYPTAAARVKRASRLEPLNPLHTLRSALLLCRFGEFDQAGVVLEHLKQTLPASPLVDYVRALVALRAGRPKQARAIAGTLETSHPNFVYCKFLKADAQIVLAGQASKIEKYLAALPGGAEYESLWADLLVKIALLHPADGPALAEKYLGKKLRPDSASHGVVVRALAWARAQIEELENLLERERPDSRAEELILGALVERLKQTADNVKAVEILAALRRRHPQRRALKRIESAFVTRIAAEKSGARDYQQALRLVERCLLWQPQDPVYHQNRAALFTLLGEASPYHESWAALNRHQYRLMLLGALDSLTLSQTARVHRLFAQQARYGGSTTPVPGTQRAIFRQAASDEQSELKRIRVDEFVISVDPELLRQWIHHSCAELVFRHCLLGADPEQLLLYPVDRDEASSRAHGLASLAESLVTLAPDEGARLVRLLVPRWKAAAETIGTRYGAQPPAADEGVHRLRLQHLELLADLALFCREWQPSFQQLPLAEELLKTIRAERSFFDEQVLHAVMQGADPSYPMLVLADHIRRVTGLESGKNLSPEQREAAIDSLMGDLLLRMAGSAYNGAAGTAQEQVTRAMVLIDRARACNPVDAEIELTAARFLVIGEFYDEAFVTLDRFHRLVSRDDHESLANAEEIEQILKERRKKKTTSKRRPSEQDDAAVTESSELRIGELERELDRAPSSWRLYEEMTQELVKAGRFDDAVVWADRALAHCLSRALQMNARALAIETRALKTLAEAHPTAARLYVVGAHEPARKALESLAAIKPLDYTMLFLLGRCHLAAGATAQARATFGEAAGLCERQLHRSVLRHLTNDIDNAYLEHARSAVNAALQDGSVEEALHEAVAVFTRLEKPAAWLIEFARVFYSAALARLGTAQSALTVPQIPMEAEWAQRVNLTLQNDDDVERALGIAMLAEEVHQPSQREAQTLIGRINRLKRQLIITDALNTAGRLLTERRFDSVLAMLDQPDQDFESEPRFIRLHVLALLGLNRFDEADQVVNQAATAATQELRDFFSGYPALVFRQRLTLAHRFLQDAKVEDATEVLAGAHPTNGHEEAGLAYCRAFGLALEAHQCRRAQSHTEARANFLHAMTLLEAHLSEASNGLPHVIELYERLEKELESYD